MVKTKGVCWWWVGVSVRQSVHREEETEKKVLLLSRGGGGSVVWLPVFPGPTPVKVLCPHLHPQGNALFHGLPQWGKMSDDFSLDGHNGIMPCMYMWLLLCPTGACLCCPANLIMPRWSCTQRQECPTGACLCCPANTNARQVAVWRRVVVLLASLKHVRTHTHSPCTARFIALLSPLQVWRRRWRFLFVVVCCWSPLQLRGNRLRQTRWVGVRWEMGGGVGGERARSITGSRSVPQ